MPDPYKNIRKVLGAGSHLETASGSGGSLISLDEAQRMGVDISDLIDLPESGTTDVTHPSVEAPKEQHTHIGVRMPSAPKTPVDARPQTGHKDGKMIGVVTATTKPVYASQKKGSHVELETTWVGQRFYPDGLKQSFGSESEAKKFASGGETVKWYRPTNSDPWESMDAETRDEAVQALFEKDSAKFERCVKKVKGKNRKEGRPAKGTEDDKGNPWAICHASTDEGSKMKAPTALVESVLNEFFFFDPASGEVVDYEVTWPDYEHGYYQAVEEVARRLIRKSLEELGIDEEMLREYHSNKTTPEAVIAHAMSEQGLTPSRRSLKRYRPGQHGYEGETSEWDTPRPE